MNGSNTCINTFASKAKNQGLELEVVTITFEPLKPITSTNFSVELEQDLDKWMSANEFRKCLSERLICYFRVFLKETTWIRMENNLQLDCD